MSHEKYLEIENHFAEHYSNGIKFGREKQVCTLTCIHKAACGFDEEREASCSGALGDTSSEIMVIGESPSTGWGKNAFVSGTSEYIAETDSNLSDLLRLIKSKKGIYPYFTDLVKCGVERTTEKKKLRAREKLCSELHLTNEIRILRPKVIICVGRYCFDFIKKMKKGNPKLFGDAELIQLTHWSNRASLTLSPADKRNVIWPLELGLLTEEERNNGTLKLEHFEIRKNRRL